LARKTVADKVTTASRIIGGLHDNSNHNRNNNSYSSSLSLARGKGGPKRIRFIRAGGAIRGVTKPAIRRLARRGGVKRISGLIYAEARGVLKIFLNKLIRDAIIYMEHAQRKTLTAKDVCFALKNQGKTIYGFDN